jgi:hypothetical protein
MFSLLINLLLLLLLLLLSFMRCVGGMSFFIFIQRGPFDAFEAINPILLCILRRFLIIPS